jgi:hypothetical protein
MEWPFELRVETIGPIVQHKFECRQIILSKFERTQNINHFPLLKNLPDIRQAFMQMHTKFGTYERIADIPEPEFANV